MIDFRLVDHKIKKGEKLIEIWEGENFIGSIYPTEKGIKIVSKHFINSPEAAIKIDKTALSAILIDILK
jgi:hypothetical protein